MSQQPTTITVHGDDSYDVVIGQNLLDQIPVMLGESAQRVLIIHPAALAATAEVIRTDLAERGLTALLAEVPDAEESKTAQVAAFCWQVLGQANFTRSDAIIGLGGGATTDLAGFVAATWLRGVKVVQIPTTVLGMVDAAVGGKTGINTAEGKNLVGAFHPPAGVIVDLASLVTMPRHDFVAGLGEVVKCGFIADEEILNLIEGEIARDGAAQLLDPAQATESAVLREIVERAIQVKADVVGQDLKESGLREILNYGHTFGHAIELEERYQWRHGAAVSVGMMFAGTLAVLAGKLDEAVVDRQRTILTALGLPVSYAEGKWDKLLAAMQRDKKTRGNLLRFVILEDVGRVTRLEGPDPTLLVAAYAEVSRPAARTIAL